MRNKNAEKKTKSNTGKQQTKRKTKNKKQKTKTERYGILMLCLYIIYKGESLYFEACSLPIHKFGFIIVTLISLIFTGFPFVTPFFIDTNNHRLSDYGDVSNNIC